MIFFVLLLMRTLNVFKTKCLIKQQKVVYAKFIINLLTLITQNLWRFNKKCKWLVKPSYIVGIFLTLQPFFDFEQKKGLGNKLWLIFTNTQTSMCMVYIYGIFICFNYNLRTFIFLVCFIMLYYFGLVIASQPPGTYDWEEIFTKNMIAIPFFVICIGFLYVQ